MSQRILKTTHQGKNIEVLLGWDQPLCRFFMQIYEQDDGENESVYIYNNLDDEALRRTKMNYVDQFQYFKGIANALGVVVPASIWSIVYNDMDEGTMNVTTYYDASGFEIKN
jgi:hypothetical protein